MRRTFIQITEIWTPSSDRSILEHRGGLYGRHHQFRVASERLCFGYDQGLPGKAWAARHPIVLRDLQTSYFKRGPVALAAGISCGVALPIFAGDYLLAVLVFFCGDDEDHVGAIELWHNNPQKSAEMKFVDGYFGIAESFEFTARHTSFMRGFGAPGMVWQSAMPLLLRDLANSQRFLRNEDARRVGINKGLGLPSLYAGDQTYVLSFLSALGTPVARRYEIWAPDETGLHLRLLDGVCDREEGFAGALSEVRIEKGWGLIGQVWQSGLPAVCAHIDSEQTPVGQSAAAAGLAEVALIPVLEDGRLKAVVALYF